jgi:hypothetical protein
MTFNDISNIRLHNHQIATSNFKSAKDLVAWMGAMQAQDYAMAKWAIGVRLPGSTDISVENALCKGELIRTHLLRPTWHIVSSSDIYWILELTAHHLKPLLRARFKLFEISDELVSKSKTVIGKVLSGGNHLTRDEIMNELNIAHIEAVDLRLYHLMMACELDGIVCNGITKGKKLTYALLEERVPRPGSIPRDEALAELARRYFTSHGPATLQDFIWWSGLSVKDARSALESIKKDFISETVEQQILWFSGTLPTDLADDQSAYLLPAYDEFIISYRDRNASIASEHHKNAISANGFFHPILVANGQIKGTWKRTLKKDKVLIESNYFQADDHLPLDLLENTAIPYGKFLNLNPEILNKPE